MRSEGRRGPSLDVDAPVELEAALGDELSLELDQAAEAEQSLDVLVAIARAEHAGEVVSRGDLGPEAAAKWLALCASAQVVVTARTRRLRDELELTSARL